MKLRQLIAAFALLLGGQGLAQQARPDLPPVEKPLPEATDKRPQAHVVLAPYRYDDILWENDRTAHRIYGRPLEAAEPPSGSGIDSWGKNVPWPFMERQLRTGDQHAYHGEGLDFYNVGTGRGAGGLGIWYDNKLWTSRNYRTYRILQDGPDVADFEVSYAPWPVDVSRKVWETRRFTLPLGTHFTRLISTIRSDKPGPLIVGIGIGKHTGPALGQITVDRKHGLMTWWGPEDGAYGRMAVALRVDPSLIVDSREDADNYLFLLKIMPGKPFVYYSGSAWNKGMGGMTSAEKWNSYAATQALDFTPPRPVKGVKR